MRFILKIALIMIVLFGCSENRQQNMNMQSSGTMLGEFSIDGMLRLPPFSKLESSL